MLSFNEAEQGLSNGSLSVVGIVNSYLARIKENASLNIFLETFEHEAQERAAVIDKKLAEGTAGKLAGAVIAIKDNLCYKGHKVSASSKILEGFTSLFTSTALQRLIDEDAVIIGRTNCDEFAMGSSNENSAFGPVGHPLDPNKVSGGSSGGSAAAVAAGMCMMSLGSDTGGSIRQPASFCGVVGMKPTYGRVSRYGLIAFASSFDQIGPFANSVEDVALVYEIMAGNDQHDSTTSKKSIEPYVRKEQKGLKLAYIADCLNSPSLDPQIKADTELLIERLKEEGHSVEEVEFPYLEQVVPTYYVLTTAEASSNLARYDGIHYGHRAENATGIDQTYTLSRTEGFGEEVKRRIMVGTFVLSDGYYDAYYAKAQKVRRVIQNYTEDLLSKYDHLIIPTTPTTAFNKGENANDPIAMYLQDIFTVQANLSGGPAISIPLGTSSNGMPYGIQVMSAKYSEHTMFNMADLLNGLLNKGDVSNEN